MKEFKKFLINHASFSFLVLSTLILIGTIHLYNYNELRQERLKAERLEQFYILNGYYNTVATINNISINKLTFIDIENHINNYIQDIPGLIHNGSFISNDKYYCNLSYENINETTLINNLDEFKSYLNNLCGYITDICIGNYIDVDNVVVNLINYNNEEQILLSSINSEIVLDIYDNSKKDGTPEDWLELYEYMYHKQPESEEELLKFKSWQKSLIYKNNTL